MTFHLYFKTISCCYMQVCPHSYYTCIGTLLENIRVSPGKDHVSPRHHILKAHLPDSPTFDYFYVMNSSQRHILDRITIQPGLMGGRPTIRGLRFTVGDLQELLANGLSEKDILEQHPILEKEDIAAALYYADYCQMDDGAY